jgi:hypothetical protein
MYNCSERSTNHIDVDSTIGNFRHLFDLKLYGYYFEEGCGYYDKPGYLKFTLFFANPFDPKIRDNEANKWPCKEELDGFKDIKEFEQEIKRKNIQIVTLEYKDGRCYEDPGILEKMITGRNSYLPHIEDLKDNSLLYKVSFDIPVDAIANYVTVDKILMNDDGGFAKEINLYSPSKDTFLVETLFRKLNRVESILTEMGDIVREIRLHPEIYEKDHEYKMTNTQYDVFWKDCHDKDEKRRMVDGRNMKNAESLLSESQKSFKNMSEILFGARFLDVNTEPKDLEKISNTNMIYIQDMKKIDVVGKI